MVHTLTFIGVTLCFLIVTIFCERYFMKCPPKYGIGKVLVGNIIVVFVLLTMVAAVPKLFPILIYGSVIAASFVCSFSRHKRIGRLAE